MLRSQRETLKELREVASVLVDRLEAPIRFALEYKDESGASVRHADFLPGQSYTFLEVLNEARRIARRIRATRFGQHSLVPSSLLSQTLKQLRNIDARVTTISAALSQIREDARPLQLASGAAWVVRDVGQVAYNLEEHAVYIAEQSEGLKAALPALITADETRSSDDGDLIEQSRLDQIDVGKIAAEVSRKSKKIDAMIAELERDRSRLLGELEAALEDARGAKTAAAEAAASVHSSRSEAEEQKRTAESHVAAIDSSLVLVRERAEEASRIIHTANENTAAIESLIRKLESADTRSKSLSEKIELSSYTLKLQTDQIDDIIQRASEMLSVSTVTGLASSFASERESLEKSMRYALFGFVVGIALLFLTTGALAAYVLEMPFGIGALQVANEGITERIGDEVTLAGVLSRTIILLAPFWVALFSARRYNALFDLRQHYSHKYNLAFAVDGFQKQAPQHKELLAALVFQKIMSNPVDAAKS